MPTDPQMKFVRQQVNDLIEVCAEAAARGGAGAVRALKIAESAELPPGKGVVVSEDYAQHLAALARQKEQENR